MKTCTYDNPATMRRECWIDGRLICSYAMEVFLREMGAAPIFFGANIGDWKTGQLIGDKDAISWCEYGCPSPKEMYDDCPIHGKGE
jgi:hypothetical protein